MKKAVIALVALLVLAAPAMAEEFAIIKDSLFGSQKIEFYASREEALRRYNGEGKIYRITKTEIPVKRIETRKKVEVTEYGWVIDDVKAPVKKPALPAKQPAPAAK
jgi:hypothetical protein